ncbi:MAG: winged helix-turn-helix transcriptional regulator [Blastocatellia bacterium]|nr:winged helix-turn-helix transcriptional regulator [Blastocatellia bacterium]
MAKKKTDLPQFEDRECVNALKALGEDNRMRIIRLLMDAPLGVCEIARRLGMEYYNVSRHLRVLRDAGLLDVEKHGRERVYVVPERILRSRAHARVLDLGCCSFQFDHHNLRSRG